MGRVSGHAIIRAESTSSTVTDSDLFWHLATARLMFERGLVGIDQFSWTVANASVTIAK